MLQDSQCFRTYFFGQEYLVQYFESPAQFLNPSNAAASFVQGTEMQRFRKTT